MRRQSTYQLNQEPNGEFHGIDLGTVNEVSGRKTTTRTKLNAVSQEETLLKWKKHFKNLLGDPYEITYPKNYQ